MNIKWFSAQFRYPPSYLFTHENMGLIFSIYKDKGDFILYQSFKLILGLLTLLILFIERYKYLLK